MKTHEDGKKKLNVYSSDRRAVKILITVLLFLSWLCLGYYGELFGPFMTTLRFQLNTTYVGYGKGLSIRSTGYFLGSILGGYMSDKYEDHLYIFVSLSLALGGLTTTVIPFLANINLFYFIIFLSGISHGTLSTAGNPIISCIWLDKSSGPFNFMHSGYGFGGLITAFVIKIFNETPEDNESSLRIIPSFLTATICNMIMAAIFIILFIRHRYFIGQEIYKEKRILQKCHETETESEKAGLSKLRRTLKEWIAKTKLENPYLILLITAIYFCLVGNERIASKFLFSYAEKGVTGTTKNDPILLHGLFWLFFSVGRICVAILSLKIPILWLYLSQIVGSIVFSTCLTLLPPTRIYLLVFATIFAFFKSPLFPTTLGVFGRIGHVTGLIILFCDVGGSFGAVSYQFFASLIIETYGISTFPAVLCLTSVAIGILASSLIYYAHKYRKTFKITISV